MYRLEVFHSHSSTPTEVLLKVLAADAMEAVRDLLNRHQGCERIVVSSGGTQLFAVDCAGSRIGP